MTSSRTEVILIIKVSGQKQHSTKSKPKQNLKPRVFVVLSHCYKFMSELLKFVW